MDPRRRFVLGLGGGAIVIALLVWLLRGDGGEGGTPATEVETSVAEETEGLAREPASEVDPDTARRELLDSPDIRWNGAASGRLVLADDLPVAGVQVMAIAYLRTEDPAEHLASAPTDAEGRFRIEGLRPDLYYVIALRSEVYAASWRERPFLAMWNHACDVGSIRVEPLRRVEGRVVDRQGRPLAGAVVRDSYHHFAPSAPSDASGAFALRLAFGDELVLQARLHGYIHHCRSSDRFRLDAANAESLITLEMVPERAIHGRVVSADGSPIPDARVIVSTQPKGSHSELGDYSLSVDIDRTTTDSEGRFVSRAPEGEGIWIDVVAGPGAMGGMSFAADQSECEIQLDRERSLRVRCVDRVTGEAVLPRALYELPTESRTENILSWAEKRPVPISIDAESFLYFRKSSKARILAQADGYWIGASDVVTRDDVRLGRIEEIVIALRPGGGVQGSCVDESGRPIQGMVVDLEAAGASPLMRSGLATTTDVRGRFVLPGLESARLQISAYHRSGRVAARVPIDTTQATSPTETTLVVRASGALRGRVHDGGVALPSVPVFEVPRDREPTRLAVTNSAGHFFVSELPSGQIDLALFAGTKDENAPVLSNSKSVTIEDGMTAELSFDLADTKFALVRGAIHGRGSEYDRWVVKVEGASRTWRAEVRGGRYLAGPLLAGTYTISVSAEHTGEMISRKTVEVAPRARLTVDFEIDAGVLVGQLVLPKEMVGAAIGDGSEAWDDFVVTLVPFVRGADIELGDSGARSFRKRIPDETGGFRFTQVEAGEYVLRVRNSNSEVDAQAERVVQVSAQAISRVELALEASGTLEVLTPPLGPDEPPIPALRLRLVRSDGVTSLVQSDRASASDPFPFRKLAPGRYALTVVNETGNGFEDGPTAEITIASGATSQWVLPRIP